MNECFRGCPITTAAAPFASCAAVRTGVYAVTPRFGLNSDLDAEGAERGAEAAEKAVAPKEAHRAMAGVR